MGGESTMRIITIPVCVWRCAVVIYCGGERDEAFKRFAKQCKIEQEPMQPNNAEATTLTSGMTKDAAIWFRDKEPCAGVVAHEAVHAALHILRASEVADEEATAYLVDFIVREFEKSKRVHGRRR